MLKRKIYKDLLKWKNSKDKLCLLVKGARQIGKTYIIDKFCRENYDNYIYLNFYENEKFNAIFDDSLKIDDLISKMKMFFQDSSFVPNKTVIFLDEIQECPNAITALKFFSIDKRYDVVASGSMLGINYKPVKSYPTGYIEHLEMHSLDFEEFLVANGISEESIKEIKIYYEELKSVPNIIHDKMLELFREYIVVGGMPAVVNSFINEKDYNKVLSIQRRILSDYKMDISKYATGSEIAKIHNCFDSIPKQLAKENKKFQFSLVEKNGRLSKYKDSLGWLSDAGFINTCYNLTTPELPLEGNSINEIFKIYLKDTGLLIAMLDDGTNKEILNNKLGVYKGAIYENIIADIFAKLHKKLYYFEYRSTLEIDFVIKLNDCVVGIEVKSGDNTKSKSLNSFIDNWGVQKGIKLSTKNISVSKDGKIIVLPLYMAMFLKEDYTI